MNKVIMFDEIDEHRIIQDGEIVRVPLMHMRDANPFPVSVSQIIADSAPSLLHRPGFVAPAPANDTQTAAERALARDAKLEGLWRDLPPEPPVPAPSPNTTTRDGDIWAARDQRLEDAWRNA